MSESEESSSSSWSFSMELLSHVHTLRVFLLPFSPQVKPDRDCASLEATLLSAPPALSCTWQWAHQASCHSLCLPLPLLLFDYSASPRLSALPDCIQLSLTLLPLPPSHLHAFSSLSLAHDGICMDIPDGVPRLGHDTLHVDNGVHVDDDACQNDGAHVAIPADNGLRDYDNAHDGICTHIPDDIPRLGHDALHVDNGVHVDDDACQNDGAHEIGHAGIPADNGFHDYDNACQSHEHDGTRAIGHVAVPGDNGFHYDDYVRQSPEHDGACETGYVDISNGIPRLGHDALHVNNGIHVDDDACQNDGTHEIGHVAILADNGFHDYVNARQSDGHDGTGEIGHVAVPGDNGFHYDDDAHQSPEHDGACETGHVAISADNRVHGDDSACQSHKDSGTHEIRRLADNGFHGDGGARQSHEHAGTHETAHVANRASNICGCHHDGTREVDHDGADVGDDICTGFQHAIHTHDSICSHEQPTNGPSACFSHHKDGIEHMKANVHPTYNNNCSSVHDEDEAFEGSLHCQHGRNMAHLTNQGSCPTDYSSSTPKGFEDHPSQGAAIFRCKECLVKVSKNPLRNLVQLPCFDWRDVVENWFGACCCSFGSTAEALSASFEKSLMLKPGKCLVGPSTFYVDFSDVTVDTQSVLPITDSNIRQWSTLRFLALGNGFMVWENQQSKFFNWLPVYCASCASLIGAYPCKTADSGSIREGLHLFRCQITTFNADGTLYDANRYITFKDLLVKELRLRTDENSSYRFLIRSLSSQLPLLQLVVLSYDSLICTGRVTDLGEHPQSISKATGLDDEVGLQQCMKVLFLDCTRFSAADEIRSTEHWVLKHDAETIFMLEEFVDKLKNELLANSMFCPAACGLLQSFHGSFLYTSQE